MKIGVCGLGLIGGSFAKAYKAAGQTVYGYDLNEIVCDYAQMTGAMDGVLDETMIPQCDYLFIALYPEAVAQYLEKIAPLIGKNAVVVDLCGTKRRVCRDCFAISEQYGFSFIGGHPMAGTQYSGLKHARAELFRNATMILVPKKDEDLSLLEKTKEVLKLIGFGAVITATAEVHDENIAYTSQLAHVVSNAYVKSPRARVHRGFSAGSYRDLTRVAQLNSRMWTQLFMDNADNLIGEIDLITQNLAQYSEALKNRDEERLMQLLEEGSSIKKSVDGMTRGKEEKR